MNGSIALSIAAILCNYPLPLQDDEEDGSHIAPADGKRPEQPKNAKEFTERAKSRLAVKSKLKDLDRAIQLDPNYAPAYLERGLVRAFLEEFQPAIDDFTRAIQLDPLLPGLHLNRGLARIAIGELKAAERDQAKALELSSENARSIYEQFGRAKLKRGHLKEALADYEKLVELDPNSHRAYGLRADARSAMGDHRSAIEDLTRSIELFPGNPSDYLSDRAMQKYRIKDFDGATQDFEQVTRLDPKLPYGHYGLGFVRMLKGEFKQAVLHYSKAIDLKDDFTLAYVARGDAKMALLDVRDASSDYALALKLEPDDAWSLFQRGICRYNLKAYDDALADLSKAADLDEQIRSVASLWKWLVLSRTGKKVEADKTLEHLLDQANRPEDKWQVELARVLSGKSAEDDLFNRIELSNEEQKDLLRTQTRFFIGVRALIAGDKEKAKTYFQKCDQSKERPPTSHVLAAIVSAALELRELEPQK